MKDAWNASFSKSEQVQWFHGTVTVRESLTCRELRKRYRGTHDEFIRHDILIPTHDQIIKTSFL